MDFNYLASDTHIYIYTYSHTYSNEDKKDNLDLTILIVTQIVL
jgi:hypothetical protein